MVCANIKHQAGIAGRTVWMMAQLMYSRDGGAEMFLIYFSAHQLHKGKALMGARSTGQTFLLMLQAASG